MMAIFSAINGFLGIVPAFVWAIALAGALATGCVEKLKYDHLDSKVKKEKAELVIATAKQIEAQKTADAASSAERVKTVTVYKQGATKIVEKLIYETIEKPVPAVCDRSPDSLRDIAELINAANATR